MSRRDYDRTAGISRMSLSNPFWSDSSDDAFRYDKRELDSKFHGTAEALYIQRKRIWYRGQIRKKEKAGMTLDQFNASLPRMLPKAE